MKRIIVISSSVIFLSSIVVSGFLFILSPASAEVWLSNRYAQNCSACHSPSRRNVAAKERRCTLSCQGCHVNPNGGGLRSEYGMWTQQRWLRSMKSNFFRHKGTPAPLRFQKYGNMPDSLGGHRRSRPAKTATSTPKKAPKTSKGRGRKPNSTASTRDWEDMAKNGAPLVVIPGIDYNEKDYDKSDGEYLNSVGSRSEFMARLTEDDPWRVERQRSFFGGVDFRYFYLDGESKENGSTLSEFGGILLPMALDVGVRYRPRPEHITLVLEHRYLNGPTPTNLNSSGGQSSIYNIFTGRNAESQVRSAYLLIDDLPYATYVMYGLYRPMFGHYTPDHTTLFNNLITADNRNGADAYNDIRADSSRVVHRALSFGGSPNVPFANFHYILPVEDDQYLTKYALAKDRGFAVNLGGRFVTLGASGMLSWWSTEGPRIAGGENLKTNMFGISGGMTIAGLILNVDFSTIEREFAAGQSDKGNVNTVEAKYRIWREIYAVANYATSNVARNLKKGEASDLAYGIKSFLYPGMEVELMMVAREDRNGTTGDKTETDLMQAQFHLFF